MNAIQKFIDEGYSWLDWAEHNYLDDEHDYTNGEKELELIENLTEIFLGKDEEEGVSVAFTLNKNKGVSVYCPQAGTTIGELK